jgi:hypothetical protein
MKWSHAEQTEIALSVVKGCVCAAYQQCHGNLPTGAAVAIQNVRRSADAREFLTKFKVAIRADRQSGFDAACTKLDSLQQ